MKEFYKTKQSESYLQQSIITLLRNYEELYPALQTIFSIPNGIYLSGKNKFGIIHKLKAEGLKKGIPDLCLPVKSKNKKFNILFVELKTETGKLSEEQIMIIDCLKKNGSCVEIIRNKKDFIQLINSYLGIKIPL